MTQTRLRQLRDAFGAFMTGVTVVTTHDGDGNPIGFTANSFSSVSLDPPLLLISIARTSRSYETMIKAPGFAVNVLSEGQQEVSNTFARPVRDRFATVNWRVGPNGAPILEDVSAWFDCTTHQIIEAGDHAILIGRVEAFEASTAAGLGYCRGAYFTPAAQGAAVVGAGPAVVVSALLERNDEVVLVDDGAGGLTLPQRRVGKDGARAALNALISDLGIEAAPGFIYSVIEDEGLQFQHIAFLCPATTGQTERGYFTPLSDEILQAVSDPAMRAMLEQLAADQKLGNYGIYFGTQGADQSRPITLKPTD